MTEKQKKSGGKRIGAGRKPDGSKAKIPVTFRLSSDVVDIIKKQPNQAEFIENAVRNTKI